MVLTIAIMYLLLGNARKNNYRNSECHGKKWDGNMELTLRADTFLYNVLLGDLQITTVYYNINVFSPQPKAMSVNCIHQETSTHCFWKKLSAFSLGHKVLIMMDLLKLPRFSQKRGIK